jgi:predicted nucleic acid-binding protein
VGALEVIRVVFDTNVLVSALLFGGTPGKRFDLSKAGRIRSFMSREMVEEFLRVLTYPKFRLKASGRWIPTGPPPSSPAGRSCGEKPLSP